MEINGKQKRSKGSGNVICGSLFHANEQSYLFAFIAKHTIEDSPKDY
jgi:hypothetical protein